MIKKYISEWPKDDRSKRIQNKLEFLYKSNRVIKVQTKSIDWISKCKMNGCDVFYSILNSKNAVAIIPESCNNIEFNNNEHIKLSEFTTSNFYNKLNKMTEIFSKEDWEKMEQTILIPILKYAKPVKIIDRVFGNHIKKNNLQIKSEYKKGLENIIKIIAENNINVEKVMVELYVAFEFDKGSQLQFDDVKNKINVIDEFIKELNQKYKINLKCYYKNNYFDLPHDRYIITKQAGIQIGTGLDYLDKRGKLRPMTVSLLQDDQKRKLENQVRIADDF